MANDNDREEAVRDAVDVSRSGAPAGGSVIRDRFSADEIFQRIIVAADEEVTVGTRELFFAGIAGGFAITVTFMLYASLYAKTGGDPILSALLYPLGFVFIILGDYQLYTENTLPPVALVLERLASLPSLLRIWTVVLVSNVFGGMLGALALATLTVVRMAVPAAFAVETYVFYGVGAGLVAPKVLSTLAAGRHRRWVRIATKASLACGIAVVALPLLFRPADRLPTAGLVAGFLVAYVGYKGRTALDDCEGCPEAATFPNCSGMDLADRGDGEEHG